MNVFPHTLVLSNVSHRSHMAVCGSGTGTLLPGSTSSLNLITDICTSGNYLATVLMWNSMRPYT